MAHLIGIDKGPVMDWTNNTGLDEHYRKWKKWVEVLFKGPLSEVTETIKCNYVIYWSGDHGMDLVDKMDHWRQNQWWKQRHIEYILEAFWGVHTPSN